MVPSGRVTAWVTPGGEGTVSPSHDRRMGRSKVVGDWRVAPYLRGGPGLLVRQLSRESGGWRMVIRVGLSEDAKREQGELGLRVVLPGRKFHSHPALRPVLLIDVNDDNFCTLSQRGDSWP